MGYEYHEYRLKISFYSLKIYIKLPNIQGSYGDIQCCLKAETAEVQTRNLII